jgi:RND superfamily putative drug exporter
VLLPRMRYRGDRGGLTTNRRGPGKVIDVPNDLSKGVVMSKLASWCVRWRWVVLSTWIAVILGLGAGVGIAGSGFTDATDIPDSESATAYALLADAGIGADDGGAEAGRVVWHSGTLAVNDPALQARAADMLDAVAAIPGVQSVSTPYGADTVGQISADGHTAYAAVVVDGADLDQIRSAVDGLADTTTQVAAGGQAFYEPPAAGGVTEGIGILAALVLLLLVFRSWWAAILPIVTGIAGVAVSLLLVILGSHAIDLSSTSITMAALIGLGVGIDYALFILNRHRKALMAGASVPDAIRTALNTSGRAVLFAGLTVMIALGCMFVVGMSILTGMAMAAALTVLLTMAAAVSLLPALMAMLKLKVLSKKQRRALAGGTTQQLKHLAAAAVKPTLAGGWAAMVQHSPRLAAAGALVVIGLLAVPVLSMRVGDADASSDQAGTTTREYYDLSASAFGDGFDAPLLMVAQTPDASSAAAFGQLVAELPAVPNVAGVVAPRPSPGQAISVATVTPGSSAQTEATQDLVHQLRDTVIPVAESGTALQVHVGGAAASSIDLADALMSKLPIYLGLIAVLGFLLLVLAFRSLLIPLVGAISNIATILVGLGALTAIFQFGWGTSLLGVGSGAPVSYILPVLIVGIMFGLSMDYQVFLISRMHEEWEHTHDNKRAVRVGVRETGQVIAAAAAIMFCVFASFGFSGERIVASIGVGLAIAVLVDAFVVRMTLIPALMTMIGRRNWYFPRWADRIIPRISIEGPTENTPAAPEMVRVGV